MVFKATRLKKTTQNVGLDEEEDKDLNWWGGRAQYLEVKEIRRKQLRISRRIQQ